MGALRVGFVTLSCVSLSALGAELSWWAVPPMSGEQYLPDRDPVLGERNGTLRISMAKEEYEPASFVLKSDADLGKATVTVGKLVDERGNVFPSAALDLKVVKVWYQNGNGWYHYFGDSGNRLCPELLMHDEDLIRVDTAREANYARLGDREQWLNPPRQIDPGFESMRPEFSDAETLRPVTLAKGFRKQFFLTAHATKDTPAGLYRGEVEIKGGGGQWKIPVALRVHDFILPPPKCYVHPEMDFLNFFYHYNEIHHITALNGGDEALAWKQLEAILANYRRHGQDMHWIRSENDWRLLDLMRKVGMRTDVVAGGVKVWDWFNPNNNAVSNLEARAVAQAAYYDRKVGHHNIFITHADEPVARWWLTNRWVFDAFSKYGFRAIIATREDLFWKMNYAWGLHVASGDPGETEAAPRLWNALGTGTHCAWYAGLHVGPENPDFNRRQYGMAAYLGGYSANCNYAHHLGPYNDASNGYRPMVFAYGCGNGVLDTLQWEGFREGIDDIRYATEMCRLARTAAESPRFELSTLGRRALALLAGAKRDSVPLDEMRAEMTRYILDLRPALGADCPPPLFQPVNDKYVEGPCGYEPEKRPDAFASLRAPEIEKSVSNLLVQANAAKNPSPLVAQAAQKLVTLCTFLHSDNCVGRGDWAAAEPYWQRIQALLPRTTNFTWEAGAALQFARFRRAVGDRTGAAELYDAALSAKAAKPDVRLTAAILKALLQTEGDAQIAACRAAAAPLKPSEKDFDAALLAVAKALGGLGNEATLRRLAEFRRTSFAAKPPRKVCTVRYSDRAIAGALGFAAVEAISDAQRMDRAYGGSTDYFGTDVSTVRGEVKAGTVDKKESPRLDVLADVWGVHFRMTVPTAEARQIEAGFAAGPNIEAYVVPGEDAAELGVFTPLRTGQFKFYNTAYESEGHRRADANDPRLYRHEAVYGDDSIVFYYALSWDLFPTRIPTDGAEWDCEQTLWGKSAYCWNGIENVHSRSSMGKLKFRLTDAQRAAIYRSRLARLKDRLNHFWTGEKTSFGMFEGIIDHWKDPAIGDTAFYEAVVKPLEETLDGASKRIVPEMDDKTVLELAETVYPTWSNLRHVIGRGRARYLRERWTTAKEDVK